MVNWEKFYNLIYVHIIFYVLLIFVLPYYINHYGLPIIDTIKFIIAGGILGFISYFIRKKKYLVILFFVIVVIVYFFYLVNRYVTIPENFDKFEL